MQNKMSFCSTEIYEAWRITEKERTDPFNCKINASQAELTNLFNPFHRLRQTFYTFGSNVQVCDSPGVFPFIYKSNFIETLTSLENVSFAAFGLN